MVNMHTRQQPDIWKLLLALVSLLAPKSTFDNSAKKNLWPRCCHYLTSSLFCVAGTLQSMRGVTLFGGAGGRHSVPLVLRSSYFSIQD